MTVRTFFAPHDTRAQGRRWNPGRVDGHMPGACQAPTTTSLDLELAVALPSTGVWAAVGPSWLPPQWPPRGSLELAGSSARFQAAVASLITLLHDIGSWGCPGWGPWVRLVWEAEGGRAQMLLPQGRPLVHSHLGSSCTGQEFSVPRQTLEPGREMLTVLLRRQVGSETKKGGGSCQMPL